MKRILVVTPDPDFRRILRGFLPPSEFGLLEASNVREVSDLLSQGIFTLAVFGPRAGQDAIEILAGLRRKENPIPIIWADDPQERIFEPSPRKNESVLTWPVNFGELSRVVRRQCANSSQEGERDRESCLGRATSTIDRLVGESAEIKAVKAYIEKIAPTNCNVLITGETGTGKECVAQLIHEKSPRASEPLMCINCAAIPDPLLESELFGYEKGAFTGAQARFAGRLVMANRGTLFLDEIGDLSLPAQAKLLRALENKEVFRLGAARPSTIDVRVIAATNRELDPLANPSGGFRADLYYRLNVARIHLPPLREKKVDIPLLVNHFIQHYRRQFAKDVQGCSEEVVHALMCYDWPGNVRELKNVIESGFVNAAGRQIEMDSLPFQFKNRVASFQTSALSENDRVMLALLSSHGNKSKAAKELGCSRMTVYRKMAKYQISGQYRSLMARDTKAGAVTNQS